MGVLGEASGVWGMFKLRFGTANRLALLKMPHQNVGLACRQHTHLQGSVCPPTSCRRKEKMAERRGLTARSLSSRREKEVGGRPLAGRQIFGAICTLMRLVG